MLFSNDLLPIITKLTRLTNSYYTSTLIDHIYTNFPLSNITAGILTGSSENLTFRIFADDTNIFYSSNDPEQLQMYWSTV